MPTLGPRPWPLPPERLDELPPEHPAARAGRRDLARINALMGNHRWLAARLVEAVPASPGPVLELGAGDTGHLAAYRRVGGLRLAALDLAPRPADWPADWDWIQADLLAASWPEAEIVIASLVLHHFDAAALRALGRQLAARSRLLFVEPARRRRHLAQGAVLGPILHPLTRHDLGLSVRAGFLPGELGPALGLDAAQWDVRESMSLRGGLRFEARRRAAAPSPLNE